jgi:hypothetical protein
MAVGIEYLSTFGALPTGARTATAFQEGQKAAADIADAQLRQQSLAQAIQFNEAQQPYRMAGLRLAQEQAAEEWRRNQEQYGRTQQALGMPLVTPGMRMEPAPSGAGLRPMAQVSGATTGLAPSAVGPYATATVAPLDYASYLQRMLPVEGTGRNARSTAQGPGQFIDSTFVTTFRETFPDASRGMSDAQILAQRGTGVEQAMLKTFTQRNVDILERAGITPTNTNAYLAHFLGAGDAVKVLSAPPNTPINQLVSSRSIAANPEVFSRARTAGELQTWAAGKMGERGGQTVSSAGVPMTYTPTVGGRYATGGTMEQEIGAVAPTGSIFTGLPLSERPIASALSSFFGGQSPAATPVTPAPAPGVQVPPSPPSEVFTSTPMGASIFQAPGVQAAPAQTVSPFEIMEPMRIAQAQDIARRKAEYLKSAYERARLMGNVEAMDKIQLETATFGTEVEALDRMNALTQFNAGNVAPIAAVLNKMTKGRMVIEPRSDGKFNIYDGKRKTADGLTKEELATQLRLGFDQDFKARVEAQRQAEIKLNEELVKARIDIMKEANKQAAQQVRELSVEQVKAQIKRPNIRVTKGDEGFVLADDLGNVSWMTVQPEVGIDGKPVYNNPVDPKSGFKTRLVISPGRAPGGVPMQ